MKKEYEISREELLELSEFAAEEMIELLEEERISITNYDELRMELQIMLLKYVEKQLLDDKVGE